MKRSFLRLAAAALLGGFFIAPALAQTPSAYPVAPSGLNATNITTDATTTVKSGAGILGSVCVNTVASGETITIYDNTAASGTKIGTITSGSGQFPSCETFNAKFYTGLTVVTGTAAGDLTVLWK